MTIILALYKAVMPSLSRCRSHSFNRLIAETVHTCFSLSPLRSSYYTPLQMPRLHSFLSAISPLLHPPHPHTLFCLPFTSFFSSSFLFIFFCLLLAPILIAPHDFHMTQKVATWETPIGELVGLGHMLLQLLWEQRYKLGPANCFLSLNTSCSCD